VQGRSCRWQQHAFALRPIGEILPFEFDEYVAARIECGAAASTILKDKFSVEMLSIELDVSERETQLNFAENSGKLDGSLR